MGERGISGTRAREAMVAVLGLVAALAPGIRAAASEPSVSSLSWVRLPGAEQCISTQALAARVERRLGHRVFVSASQADLSLEGRVERDVRGKRWLATLVVSDRNGHTLGRRALHAAGDDCAAIDDSLVLVVAIAIDPGAVTSAVLGPPEALSPEADRLLSQLELPRADAHDLLAQLAVTPAPEKQPQPSAPRVDAPPARVALRAPAAAHRWQIALHAGGAAGVLPDTAFGSQVRVAYRPANFVPIELSVFGYLPQTNAIAGASSNLWRAAFSLVGGGAHLCPLGAAWRPLEIALCTGFRVGALSARGRGFSQDLESTGTWAQADAQLQLALGLGRFQLQLRGGPGAAWARPHFEYEDGAGQPRTAFRPEILSFALAAGVGFAFP